MTITPAEWLSFTFQGQDARVLLKENPTGTGSYTNRFDLRMAYADFGNVGKGSLALRVGRQELAYGEERLVGAANWGNIARTFDGVKLVAHHGPVQLDLFSASVVAPQLTGLSHHQEGNNLHGAYFKLTGIVKNASLEPYFLWRVGPGRGDVAGGAGHQDRKVEGVRLAGKLPARFDYAAELVHQNGQVGASSIGAYAAHLALRHTLANLPWIPHLFAEYNYASGDRTPGDGHSGTFDQLYPTPHEKTGLADQVGWQNIKDVAAGLDVTPWHGVTLRMTAHDWHLAEARDGIYLTSGAPLFRDPSGRAGTHIGEEIDVTGIYQHHSHSVGLGYAHLFPGEFLSHVSPAAQLNYVYLNVGYRF